MKYVLGIDAAWTKQEPSGVALLKIEENGTITTIKLARSYNEFLQESICWNNDVLGAMPDYRNLLKYCDKLGMEVDLVALDIPISPISIRARRESDSQISKFYGSYGASTHSPNENCPGPISDTIFNQLQQLGYVWNERDKKSFIEVYPHTGIIELFGYKYRLPYKVQKRAKYWPTATPEQRLQNIIQKLNELRQNLMVHIPSIAEFLDELSIYNHYSIKYLKGYEDVLDALVCALTGCFFMINKAKEYGDKTSTIWVPQIC